ncbi:MAG: cation diffusion facilitator family transporter, partial [Bdellovibrionales bacterium]
SIYEGIHHIRHPAELKDPTINYVVLGLAIIFEGGALYFAVTEFNKVKGKLGYLQAVRSGKDPSLFVVLFEDSAAMLGLLVALVGIWFAHYLQMPVLDGVASVLIGVILGITAIWLAVETKGLLIGEPANKAKVEGIKKIVSSQKGVENVNEVLTLHMGPEYILVTISAAFDDDMKVTELEKLINDMTDQIQKKYPRVQRVFIEAEA